MNRARDAVRSMNDSPLCVRRVHTETDIERGCRGLLVYERRARDRTGSVRSTGYRVDGFYSIIITYPLIKTILIMFYYVFQSSEKKVVGQVLL